MVNLRNVMIDLDKPLDEQLPQGLKDALEADGTFVALADGKIGAEKLPSVFRTTDSQPFAADSIWNTPVGSDCQFQQSTDPATQSFLAATPAINDTLNGYGFYLNIASPTDPVCTASYTNSGNGQTYTFQFRCPYDPVISTGTDLSMRVIDGDKAYDLWKTTKTGLYTFTAEFITVTDLTGTGRNAGTRAARFPTSGGLIRTHELAKCHIPHALCISIPGTSLKRGFVWPAAAEDAPGVTYSGQVPMGSFFAIPPSVNVSALSLSPEGMALAKCLQNYGMYVGDQSGSAAISVEGEAAVSIRPALERMRADWNTLFPMLRMVSNVDTNAGGPGLRRVPKTGPVGIRTDYQETKIDLMADKLLALSGARITSEDAKTPVDPIVSLSAGMGGNTYPLTGWPAQYRIFNGALRRVASPDGQARILLFNPGIRDFRMRWRVTNMHTSGFSYAILAATGSSEHYALAVTSQGSCHIQRVLGGVRTSLSPALPNGTVGVNKEFEFGIRGPKLWFSVNGETLADAIDTSNMAGTQHGVYFASDANMGWTLLDFHNVPRLARKPRVEA
ncbi:hypothetical protein SEA_GIBBLES_34 [Gordonia phage Gibbles]|nr:hypothetical protein SEA_GIBBLES_34 [Gordonia phage Gibbles]